MLLGDLYLIESFFLCPTTLGWPSRRRRLFIVGTLRALSVNAIRELGTGLEAYTDNLEGTIEMLCARTSTYTPKEYCVATNAQLRREHQRAGNRLKVRDRHSDQYADPFSYDLPNSWEHVLNPYERNALDEFSRRWPEEAWDLQTTEKRISKSKLEGPLHTVVKGIGLLWVSKLEPPRYMTSSELAASMGFPVISSWADASGVPCLWTRDDNDDAATVSFTGSVERVTKHQVGNSMHINSIGAVLLAMCIRNAHAFCSTTGASHPIGNSRAEGASAASAVQRDSYARRVVKHILKRQR